MGKVDFRLCWGCWEIPSPVSEVFCPACKEKEEKADAIKMEAEYERKRLISERATQRRKGKYDYYNY